jgi:hypothetical protein
LKKIHNGKHGSFPKFGWKQENENLAIFVIFWLLKQGHPIIE